jgi:hypothetical protein
MRGTRALLVPAPSGESVRGAAVKGAALPRDRRTRAATRRDRAWRARSRTHHLTAESWSDIAFPFPTLPKTLDRLAIMLLIIVQARKAENGQFSRSVIRASVHGRKHVTVRLCNRAFVQTRKNENHNSV